VSEVVLSYLSIEFRPVAGTIGADVRGLDLSRPLSNAVAIKLRRALVDYLVLFFRDQRLAPEHQLALSARLGPLLRVPYVKHLDEHPDIIAILKEAHERTNSPFGNGWHSDFSFLEEPPMGSILYAREVPRHGGDTLWCNMYEAYEALSVGMKRMLTGLKAMHSLPALRSVAAGHEVAHPVVRFHPKSGRKALFVNAMYTVRFKDMTEAESRPLLNFLFQHCIRPEFTCRFRWAAGSLAIWDNRCTLHYAVNDYHGCRRLMHRTTIAGDRPIPARTGTPRNLRRSHRAHERKGLGRDLVAN
jgi:taurine dioxygenase